MICGPPGPNFIAESHSSLFDNNTPETRTTVFSHMNGQDPFISQTHNIDQSVGQNEITSSKKEEGVINPSREYFNGSSKEPTIKINVAKKSQRIFTSSNRKGQKSQTNLLEKLQMKRNRRAHNFSSSGMAATVDGITVQDNLMSSGNI